MPLPQGSISQDQAWANKFEKLLDHLINGNINKPNEHEKCINEKYIRLSIDAIIDDDFLKKKSLCDSILNYLNQPKKVYSDAISALKFLIYAEKLMLYVP